MACEPSKAIWMVDAVISYKKAKKAQTKKVWFSSRWEQLPCVRADQEAMIQLIDRYGLQAATEIKLDKITGAIYLGERFEKTH
jgi:hypothetical protein